MKFSTKLKMASGAMVLSACLAAFTGSVQAQDQINVWSEFTTDPQASTFAKIIDMFNQTHDDVQIVHTGFENTPYETKLKTSFLGGNPADIVLINPGADMFQYAEAGQLVDLTDFVEPSKDIIQPGLESFYRFEGNDYGIPFELSVGNLFFYNADMLAARGIDPEQINTWQGLLDAMQVFKDEGVAPLAFGDSEGWTGYHVYNHLMLRLLGPTDYTNIFLRTYDPTVETAVHWTDPAPQEGWELYRGLLDKGYFTAGYLSDDYPTANALFLNGTAPFFTNGSWFIGDLVNKAPELNWGVVAFPEIEGKAGKQTDLVSAGLVASVTKASKHPEQAKEFLTFLMSEPAQKIWAEGTEKLSPYKYDTSDWSFSKQFRNVADMMATATSVVSFGDMIEDNACAVPWMWQASQGILSDSIAPDEIGEGHENCVARVRSERGFQ